MIEAVIFDWGGTLTPWKTVDAHDAWRVYAGALHDDNDAERAAEAARRLHEADLARWAGVRDEHRAFTIAQVIGDAAAHHDTAALDAYRLGTAGDVVAELDDLDLDTDLANAVVAVEWGEGVAERLSARHLLVRLERRPDDVRIAQVQRVEPEQP